MSGRARFWLLALTIVGLTCSLYATYVHGQVVRSPDIVAPCDVNATLSCSEVYRSAYATLGGVPVSLLGVCWFTLILLLLLGSSFAGIPQPANVPLYVLLASIPAMAFSLYLAWASFFVLKSACILCLLTDAAVAGLLVASGFAARFSMSNLSQRLARDARALVARPLALIVAAGFVVASIAGLGFYPREVAATLGAAPATPSSDVAPVSPASPAPPPSSGSQAASAPATAPTGGQRALDPNVVAQLHQFLDTQPRRMIPVDAQGAAVVVVKFNDYQCPPCRQTFEVYRPVKSKWDQRAPGQVKFVNKDFPLEGECNPNAPKGPHALACEAAAAVRMARRNGKAEALEDWIFANQPALTAASLKQAVEGIGAVKDFDAQYPRVLNDVKIDASLGGFLGVNSTPTFFLNGIQIRAWPPEVLDAAIEYELKKVTAGKTSR
jgi:uncharacterized membrane protein/protein-disulfide isomerase